MGFFGQLNITSWILFLKKYILQNAIICYHLWLFYILPDRGIPLVDSLSSAGFSACRNMDLLTGFGNLFTPIQNCFHGLLVECQIELMLTSLFNNILAGIHCSCNKSLHLEFSSGSDLCEDTASCFVKLPSHLTPLMGWMKVRSLLYQSQTFSHGWEEHWSVGEHLLGSHGISTQDSLKFPSVIMEVLPLNFRFFSSHFSL